MCEIASRRRARELPTQKAPYPGGLFDSRRSALAQDSSRRQTNSTSTAPVVLFGVDGSGKPKAARFPEKQAGLATKAAGHLNLQVLPVVAPPVIALADRLAVGRIHANGRGFIPYIRRDLYAKLVEAAGPGSAAPPPSSNGPADSGPDNPGSPAPTGGQFPRDWTDIAVGHVVIAHQGPDDGWYEAVVVEVSGDMLTLRWRDYPRERRISRNRIAVGLLYQNDKSAPPKPTGKPARPQGQPPGTQATAYPKTWDDIGVGSVVLAKDDGPWGSWWEAIPSSLTGDSLSLQWRTLPDMPKVSRPPVARHRLTVGLLYPNGK